MIISRKLMSFARRCEFSSILVVQLWKQLPAKLQSCKINDEELAELTGRSVESAEEAVNLQ